MKMRTRLLLTAVLLLSIGFYALVDWIVKDVRLHYFITMEESLVDTSVILAELVSKDLNQEPYFGDALKAATKRALHAEIYDHVKTNMNVRVLVIDEESKVVFDSLGKAPPGSPYPWRDARLALEGKYGARATHEIKGDPESFHFYVGAPIIKQDDIVGVVSVGKPLSSIQPFMEQARRRLVISGLIGFAAVIMFLIPVSLWIIQPVQALTKYAQTIRDGGRPPRPQLGHGGEMSELANAFEEMRDALEGKEYVEGYVQSLTHEMKSPLAAIQGAVELLNEDMPETQRQKFLVNIGTESERLHGLVERVLALASIEKRKGLGDTESVDLSVLLNDIVDSLAAVAQSRNILLALQVESNSQIQGEYFLLRQALINLIQNAIDFSSDGAKVEVFGDVNRVRVIDSGTGIPEYAMSRIFERFYSLARPGEGPKSSGLGLNFVREIARLHDGEIDLRNRPSGGAEATFSFASP